MEDSLNELYQKYLKEKLDYVFGKFGNDAKLFDYERKWEYKYEDHKYHLYDIKTGKRLDDIDYDSICEEKFGYGKVKLNGKYNLIDTNGKLVLKKWYNNMRYFRCGRLAVKEKNHWFFIDKDGNRKSNNYYDVSEFVDDFAIVRKYPFIGLINFIDTEGKELLKHSHFRKNTGNPVYVQNDSFNWLNYSNRFLSPFIPKRHYDENVCKTKDLGNYNVKKTIGGYKCFNDKEEFTIKYEPLRIYDNRYVLCIKKNNKRDVKANSFTNLFYYQGAEILLYNRDLNEYERLGDASSIEFFQDAIHHKKPIKDDWYLIYNGRKLKITEYKDKYLTKGKWEPFYNINKGLEILTEGEFYALYEDDIKKKADEKKEKKEQEELERVKAEEQKEVESKKEEEIRNDKVSNILSDEAIHSIQEAVEKLKYAEKLGGAVKKANVDNLFIKVDDYYEILPAYLDSGLIRFIDLSGFSFYKVKVSGIDFRGCNIYFNPQNVYNRDLSNCNFEGVFFPVTANFDGTDIRGSKFTTNHNSAIFDINESSFKKAKYDENTTLDGVPLTNILGKETVKEIKRGV